MRVFTGGGGGAALGGCCTHTTAKASQPESATAVMRRDAAVVMRPARQLRGSRARTFLQGGAPGAARAAIGSIAGPSANVCHVCPCHPG